MSENETRTEKAIQDMETRWNEKVDKSHRAIAGSISGFMDDFYKRLEAMDKKMDKKLSGVKTVTDIVESSAIISGLIIKISKFLIAVSIIGASFIYIIKSIK